MNYASMGRTPRNDPKENAMMAKQWKACLVLLPTVFIGQASFAAAPQSTPHWVGTWACAPVGELPANKENAQGGPRDASVTIRDVVHISLGGKVFRLRISNEFGKTPLKMEMVHAAISDGADAVQAATDHAVTFAGAANVTIPAGKAMLSDPLKMDIPAFTSLAVSMYVPQQKDLSLTYHIKALSSNYIAPGDQTAAAKLTDPKKIVTWVFLTGVDVQASPDAAAIVAYGDSITDGMRSTIDGNLRWPDDLAHRVQANAATAHLSVLNLGISGNRILYDQAGPSLLARLDRDVFGQAGVKYLIVFAGINDLHHSVNRPDPLQKESTADIIAGLQQIVARAHAHGIKVFIATITPAGGSPLHKPAAEQIRQDVNTWIRAGKGFDGVVDFDKAVRSPTDPTVLAPPYDSPDHTHLVDAGYQAVADSIDLKLFQ
jgi:lysophospholipase L1-like esterase